MVRWIVNHCRTFVCGAALTPCYVSIITSCILPWLIGTKHFPESKKHVPESKTRPRIQNTSQNPSVLDPGKYVGILNVFLVFKTCFEFVEVFFDSGTCFVPTSHRSIPERPYSLKFCNTFQFNNSDLLLTCSSLTFQTFLEFLSSHPVDVSLKEAVNQRIHTLLVSL